MFYIAYDNESFSEALGYYGGKEYGGSLFEVVTEALGELQSPATEFKTATIYTEDGKEYFTMIAGRDVIRQ
jgi:hypothetical protein